MRLRHRLHQSPMTAPESGFQKRRRVGISAALWPQRHLLTERFRQPFERRLAGAQDRHTPVRTGIGQKARFQGRQQARLHQRGLAATADAHHGQKTMAFQLGEHRLDLSFATEEKISLIPTKRPQAGIGAAAGGAVRQGFHQAVTWA